MGIKNKTEMCYDKSTFQPFLCCQTCLHEGPVDAYLSLELR